MRRLLLLLACLQCAQPAAAQVNSYESAIKAMRSVMIEEDNRMVRDEKLIVGSTHTVMLENRSTANGYNIFLFYPGHPGLEWHITGYLTVDGYDDKRLPFGEKVDMGKQYTYLKLKVLAKPGKTYKLNFTEEYNGSNTHCWLLVGEY